jgi:hypothetical protein
MPISMALQDFQKAHAIKQLENLVLDRLAPRQECAETGNIVFNECLAEALRARYRIEFLQKDSAALVNDAEAGKPLVFRAVPEYNPAFYLLGRECEQLMRQYIAEFNKLRLEIPDILRKIDNAQAAQERVLGELGEIEQARKAEEKREKDALAEVKTNGNVKNVAEKTRREAKEKDLKARIESYERQITEWSGERTAAEQQLSDLPRNAQRLSQVAGALVKKIPSGERFTTELARYGITPMSMSGKLYCDVHEKISLPQTLTDLLEVSLPSAEPQVTRRSTVKIMAGVTAGIIGTVAGGIALFNREPGPLKEGKDYVVDARESGWVPVKAIKNGEHYLDYRIGIEAGAVGENRAQEYAITFTNDKVSLAYQIPAYRLFRMNLDGKWHVFNTKTEATLDKKIIPVIVSQNRIISVRLKPVLEAQSRFVAPILKEVHTTPSTPHGIPYSLDPSFDSMNGVYLAQVDGDQRATTIRYAVYCFTDEKTAQEAKLQRYGNMHELLKRPRKLLCSGSLTVDPAKVPDSKGVSAYEPKR